MSFAGAALSMITSVRNNKRNRKKSLFDQDTKHEKGNFDEFLKKKTSSTQLTELRKQIKRDKQKDRVKAFFLLILISIVMYSIFKLFSSVDF